MQKHLALIFAVSAGVMAGCDSNSSSEKQQAPVATTTTPGDNAIGSTPGALPGDDSTTVTDGTNPEAPATETPATTPGTTVKGENGQPTAPATTFKSGLSLTRSTLLADLGNGIARKTETFHKSAIDLQTAAAAYCSSRTDPSAKAKVQDSWKSVMLQWEHFELFQIGPLADNNKTLKFAIYGWPSAANLCQIDAEAMNAGNAGYALPIQYNRKGLQAMEYLLFEKDLTSACSKANPIYANWNALSVDAREQARCNYLLPLTNELVTNAATLQSGWGPVGDNVLSKAVGNAEAEQVAIQSLYENLFYTDIELKNQKLAAIAGHDVKHCAKSPGPCLDKEELRYSGLSREAMQANFDAFADLMYGFASEGERKGGFAALVRERGNDAIALRSENYAATLSKIFGETPASMKLPEIVTAQAQENCDVSQNGVLCKLRALLKQIASDLKYEYTNILQVKVPAAPAGDND